MANRRPETPAPGSNPEVSYYSPEEGGQKWLIIDDNRTPFAGAQMQMLGGNYDPFNKTVRFNAETQKQAFDNACSIISEIPYFEIEPKYAKYASVALAKQEDFQVFKRPMRQGDVGGASRWVVMASNAEAYQKGQQVAAEVSQITDEQLKKMLAAEDKFDPAVVKADSGYESVEDMLGAAEAGLIDRPAAEKLINGITPVNETTLKKVEGFVKEGRLNEENAGIPVDKESLRNLSQRDGFRLVDRGKSLATAKDRALVQTLRDMGYYGNVPSDLNELKWYEARDFQRAKEKLLTPEQRATYEAVRKGETVLAQVPSGPKPVEVSSEYVAEFVKNHGSTEVALDGKGFSAFEVGTATPHHIVAFLDADRSKHTVIPSTNFSPDITAALSAIAPADYGRNDPLAGQVFTIHSGRKDGIAPSTQRDLGAALSERLAVDTAERVKGKGNVTPVGPDKAPAKGQGSVMNNITPGWVSILTNDNKLVTIASGNVKGEPKFLAAVDYDNAQDSDGQAPAQSAKPKRTVGAGRK